MNVMRWAVVAAAVGSAGFLQAEEAAPREEKLEEIAPKFAKTLLPWSGFAPGSWVEIRTVTKAGETESTNELWVPDILAGVFRKFLPPVKRHWVVRQL